jgi:hypothetical protein
MLDLQIMESMCPRRVGRIESKKLFLATQFSFDDTLINGLRMKFKRNPEAVEVVETLPVSVSQNPTPGADHAQAKQNPSKITRLRSPHNKQPPQDRILKAECSSCVKICCLKLTASGNAFPEWWLWTTSY